MQKLFGFLVPFPVSQIDGFSKPTSFSFLSAALCDRSRGVAGEPVIDKDNHLTDAFDIVQLE